MWGLVGQKETVGEVPTPLLGPGCDGVPWIGFTCGFLACVLVATLMTMCGLGRSSFL